MRTESDQSNTKCSDDGLISVHDHINLVLILGTSDPTGIAGYLQPEANLSALGMAVAVSPD